MPDFPSEPISAREFFEERLPAAFAEVELPEGAQENAVELGIQLDGEGGGEWLFTLVGGELRVASGSRKPAAFSLVQSVEDWRGALWGNRGGAIGRQASHLFRPGALPTDRVPKLELLAPLQELEGLIRLVVGGGEGGDWSLGLKLGPGELPAEDTATIAISAADAAAMESGELDPMQAFMTGRIEVKGDMALVMQFQLILMQAASVV